MLLANNYKIDIAEYYMLHDRLPSKLTRIYNSDSTSKYLEKVEFKSGKLEFKANTKNLGLSKEEKLSIIYSPVIRGDTLTWSCNTKGSAKYAPTSCEAIADA